MSKAYIIANSRLSTPIKMSKNIAGPTRPTDVIVRRTDKIDQLLVINESAK